MRKIMKKLCVSMLSVIICVLLGQIIPVSARGDENIWHNNGGYLTPEESQTYYVNYSGGDKAGLAIGGNIKLEYDNDMDEEDTIYEWKVTEGNEHVRMNEANDKLSANVTGISTGKARVEFYITKYPGTEYEETETESVDIEITNPRLKSDKIARVIGNEGKIEVEGNSSYAQERVLYKSDSENHFYMYGDGTFYGYAKETRKVYVYVDGICLEATVKYTDPQYRSSCILKKGQKVSYKLSGASGYTPITYKTGNAKYATVSSDGLVKGKKYGKTTLTLGADNASVTFNIYILKSKAYKGVSKAQAICKTKPTYSQAKRMQKGYVDCSSFIWKSYKPYGVNFGSKSYAPTAADIAKWCSKKKKLLKFSAYNGKSDKLLPGDLIFYKKRSGKNGRYKNIDHIAMYVGNDTIVHADGSSVSYSYPWYRKAAAIARPTK